MIRSFFSSSSFLKVSPPISSSVGPTASAAVVVAIVCAAYISDPDPVVASLLVFVVLVFSLFSL